MIESIDHLIIAVKNLDEAIRITNSLRRWTAPLLALSANSPFFEGVNTGFKSSRTMNFGNFPRTHIPPKLTSSDDFLNLISVLKEAKSIAKDRHIWWKIRPHTDFGTIEFRMCDAQRDIGRVKMLAAICQALVYQSSLDLKRGVLEEDYNYELLLDNSSIEIFVNDGELVMSDVFFYNSKFDLVEFSGLNNSIITHKVLKTIW